MRSVPDTGQTWYQSPKSVLCQVGYGIARVNRVKYGSTYI